MKLKSINQFFISWDKPVFLHIKCFIVAAILGFFDNVVIEYLSLLLFLVAYLVLIYAIVYQVYIRKSKTAITSFVGIVISILGFSVYSVFMFFYIESKPDRYADDLVIPSNIVIDTPKARTEIDTNLLYPTRQTIPELVLYQSFQGGIYGYDFYYGRLGKGVIYLKAYEITQNEQLSEDRIKERTTRYVYNPTDTIAKYSGEFTIYEGDWGKYYVARIEAWYKGDDGTEKLLMSRNYLVEGWMR